MGSYAIQNSVFDVYITIFFGILGYFLRKFGFQGSPIVLALILGPMAEYNLRSTLTATQGDYPVFATRPICLAFLIVSVLSIALPIWHSNRQKRAERIKRATPVNETVTKRERMNP